MKTTKALFRVLNITLALAGRISASWILPLVLLLVLPVVVQAQFTFTTNNNNGTITITGYTGPGGAVTIPSTTNGYPVTSIGIYNFQNTNVTSVTIPGSVTSIAADQFSQCYSLTAIMVDAHNFVFSDLDGVLFNKSLTTLVEYPGGVSGSYTIPDSVTNIGDSAFAYCTNLTGLTMGNSVTTIERWAFLGCTNLTSMTVPDSVTSIRAGAFQLCTSLSSVTIGKGVSQITDLAFANCPSLTSIFFHGNSPSAGSFVFGVGMGGWLPETPDLTVYYLPGTTGWESSGAVLWNPQMQTSDASFGVKSNHFGFNITGTNNFTVVVEASTNLASPTWSPLQTITITNGSAYFSDPQWAGYPSRFYRLSMP